MFVDPRLSDPAYRQRTWAFLRDRIAEQEAAAREEDERIKAAGPVVGDMVKVTPLQLARVVSISGSPPMATLAWDQPTGRGGGTVRMQEQRWLRDLVAAFEQPVDPMPLSLPEGALQPLLEPCQDADAEVA